MTLRNLALTTMFSSVVALAGAAEAAAAPSKASSSSSDTSERPRAFLGFLLTGAMVHEDGDNRLTMRRRGAFATPGLALRAGGVVARRHLIGGLFQGSWRSTRAVRGSDGQRDWGAISTWTIGPEYRYQASSGLYAGASLGFAFTFADENVGSGGSPDCNTWACLDEHLDRSDDRGVAGISARGVLGYEYRVRRNLAISGEAFVGVVHGDDEHRRAMTLPTWGIAVGVGF